MLSCMSLKFLGTPIASCFSLQNIKFVFYSLCVLWLLLWQCLLYWLYIQYLLNIWQSEMRKFCHIKDTWIFCTEKKVVSCNNFLAKLFQNNFVFSWRSRNPQCYLMCNMVRDGYFRHTINKIIIHERDDKGQI